MKIERIDSNSVAIRVPIEERSSVRRFAEELSDFVDWASRETCPLTDIVYEGLKILTRVLHVLGENDE